MITIDGSDLKKGLKVKFDFNLDIVNRIKALPYNDRKYDPTTKTWLVKTRQLTTLLESVKKYDVTILGFVKSTNKVLPPRANLGDSLPDTSSFEFKTSPMEHQLEGIAYGLEHRMFILGDEQGLGKTKQAIDIAVIRKPVAKHTLVICCVAGLQWNWLSEIGIHSNESGHILGSRYTRNGNMVVGSVSERTEDLESIPEEYFWITNVESLRNDDFCDSLAVMARRGDIGMCIVDEIHKCKNPSSKQGKALQVIQTFFKMALSGTLLMNSPEDLYQPLKFIEVEQRSFTDFKKRYIFTGDYGDVLYKNLGELQQELNSVMLRRTKDILNLPPKIRKTEYVDMDAKQQKLYSNILFQVKEDLPNILKSPNPLAQLTRLRQVTSAPQVVSQVCDSAKFDRCLDIVEEAANNGRKCLIFSIFEQVIFALSNRMKRRHIVITGSVKKEARQALIHSFQTEDYCALLGTVQSIGTGETITAADTVIFIDKPWTMATVEQAEDRTHRIGTKGTVTVITLVCKNTIDERVEEILSDKKAISDALIDGKVEKMIKRSMIERLIS